MNSFWTSKDMFCSRLSTWNCPYMWICTREMAPVPFEALASSPWLRKRA